MPFLGHPLASLLCRIGALAFPLVLVLSALAPTPVSADEGFATWYGLQHHGRTMANGQRFDMNDPTTTASNMFPFGTWLRVTNLANGKSISVQVRDRGAFTHALDLSYAAFAALDDVNKMRIRVKYEVVSGPGQAPAAIPAPSMAAPSPPPSPKPAPPTAESKPQSLSDYVVSAGDTLVGIAQRFGVVLADLVRVNGISNPDNLPIGSRLQFAGSPSADQRSTPPEGVSVRSAPPPDVEVAEHTVVDGETLWDIAVAFKLTPAELVTLNDISNPDQLSVGQRLRVSKTGSRPAPAAPAQAAERIVVTEHVVAEGETLWDIALKYKLTPADLATLNDIPNPDSLVPGQHLRISKASAPASSASAPTTTQPAAPTSSRPYVIQPGDTLSSIAAHFDTTLDQLKALNGLSNADLIQPGQVIKLP